MMVVDDCCYMMMTRRESSPRNLEVGDFVLSKIQHMCK